MFVSNLKILTYQMGISWVREAYELSYSGGGLFQLGDETQRWGAQKCEGTMLS